MSNYKPITRRTMEARSSILKQTTKSGTGQVQDDEGNLLTGRGDATKGSPGGTGTTEGLPKKTPGTTFKNPKVPGQTWPEFVDAPCGSPGKPYGKGMCKDVQAGTEGEAKFDYTPELTEEQRGSSIDLFTSPEGRASFRTGQSQGRFVRKTGRQFANAEDKLAKFIAKKGTPGPGEPGYRKYQRLLNKRDTFKSQSEGAQKRLENYRQMTDGMRNPYVTKRMEYNRKLQSQELGGQPVKAPEGTQTKGEFEKPYKDFAGQTSNQPVGNTGTVTSFSSLLSNDSFQPVKVGDGDLFSNIDLSGFSKGLTDKLQKKISGMSMPSANRMLKKPGAFKMKGYGSKK